MAREITVNIVCGRETKVFKIFLGFILIKSCIRYLEMAKSVILSKPFLSLEESTGSSFGKVGSSIGFMKYSSNLK